MSSKRAFIRRTPLVAVLFLIAGILIGVGATLHSNLMPVAQGATTPPTAHLPLKVASMHNVPTVARLAMPAVVNISTTRVINSKGAQGSPLFQDPFFRQFFGDQFMRRFQVPRKQIERALGSGVIISPNGYILTNNHVIAKATTIKVLLSDNREFTGKVVGADPKTDIAVVKIDAKNLPTLPWGHSSKLEVGQTVLAIGNPFGLNQTVTEGIISAVGRANVGIADYEDFIQTDAAINPGNSGGPLINLRGQVIGINTAIFSQSGGYMGIGFAIPSDMARQVMTSLIKYGKVIRGWLGVSIQQVTPELASQFGLPKPEGVLVAQVLPNSPAAHAGLKTGDVILRFNDQKVTDPTELRNVVAATPPGTRAPIELMRNGKTVTVTAKIAEQSKSNEKPPSAQPGHQEPGLAGIQVSTLTPDVAQQLGVPSDTHGVVVTSVDPTSEAASAGLQSGDVITEIDRKPIRNVDDYRHIVASLGNRKSVLLLINRQGETLFLVVKR